MTSTQNEWNRQLRKIQHYFKRKLHKVLEIVDLKQINYIEKAVRKVRRLASYCPWKILNKQEAKNFISDTSTPFSAYSGAFSELEDEDAEKPAVAASNASKNSRAISIS